MTGQNNNNLTARKYSNGRQHTFTLDTGVTQSIIRPDVVEGKCEVLRNVRLRTASEESANIHGEIEVKLTIGKVSVSYVFVVADIVDEVIDGADFVIAYSINLKMG